MTTEVTGYCHICDTPVYHELDDYSLTWCAICGMESLEQELEATERRQP